MKFKLTLSSDVELDFVQLQPSVERALTAPLVATRSGVLVFKRVASYGEVLFNAPVLLSSTPGVIDDKVGSLMHILKN